MDPIFVVVSSLLYLFSSFCLFPVPTSGIKRFDMDHVISFRHGHNAGAPAQMRIMKPPISVTRFKKSSVDFKGSEGNSMTPKSPASTLDEEHKLTKRAVFTQFSEQRKDLSSKKEVSGYSDEFAFAKNNIDQRSPGKGAFVPKLGSESNTENSVNIPSAKHSIAKETLGHQRWKVSIFETSGSSEETDGEDAPEYPVPNSIEAST